MSTYKAFAAAASINIDWDLVRRNHIRWLEGEVIRLSDAYKAARGTPEAAALKAAGIAMKARLDQAVANDRS